MISVLTTSWAGGPQRTGFVEHGLVARWVAGAACAYSEVEVLLASPQPPRTTRDGAFWIHHLPVRQFSPVEALVLARSLANGHPRMPKDDTVEQVARLAGCPNPAEAAALLEQRRPSVVILAGWVLMALAGPLRQRLPDTKVVCLPMAPPVPELGVLTPILPAGTRLLALTRRQAERLATTEGLEVETLGLPVSEPPGQARTSLSLGVEAPILVLLPSSSDPFAQGALALLRRRHRQASLVLVTEDSLQVLGPEVNRTHHFAPTRADLRHLMAQAVLTVDLRRFGVLGCDAFESLQQGTPAVVPAQSPARDLIEEADAGLWFSDPTELSACVGTLMAEAPLRQALGSQGRRFANERRSTSPPTVL